MAKRVLIPLPRGDFDPTESGVPWKVLRSGGVEVIFATPDGRPPICDERMLTGKGLGPLKSILAADKNGRQAYLAMSESGEFNSPISWQDIEPDHYDGLILPGGHAKGMREYLESSVLQSVTNRFFKRQKPVGAICHGVVLASRSKNRDGKSVLFGRKTTSLLATQEIGAWLLTAAWLGDYYRTYDETVESEVKRGLASVEDFVKGPLPLLRDNPRNIDRGFVVQDGQYLSARWPGDAHLFAQKFFGILGSK
jgi:protease I